MENNTIIWKTWKATEWEKNFTNYTFELIHKIYKQIKNSTP